MKHTDWIFLKTGASEVLKKAGRTANVGWLGSTENEGGGVRYN